jgi:hypothetical protein
MKIKKQINYPLCNKMLLVKPLIVGTVGSAFTMYQYPLGSINLFSYNMPLSAGIFVALVGGSLLADVAHDHIFPQIHVEDNKLCVV